MASKTTTTLQMVLEADDKASTKMQRLAAQLENVGTKYGLQQRAAAALKTQLDALDTSTAKGAATAAKLQLQYDKLQLSMRTTEQQGMRLTAAMSAEAQGGSGLVSVLQQLTAAQTQLAGATGQNEAAIRKQVAALQQQAAAMQLSNAQAGQSSAALEGMGSKLLTVAKGYLGIQAASAAWDAGKQGAAIMGVRDSFEKLAVTANTTGDTLLNAMKKASKGTIAESELMAKANAANILTQGRLVGELPKLLEIAGASAKAMKTDVNSAFDSIVLGLSRNSKMIIDNLGITVDIEAANRRYADSLGITVGALTDQQKAQAFTNEVLLQGDKLVQTVGTSTLTAADRIAQAETNIKNFTDSLKVMVGEGLGAALEFIPQMIGGISTGTAELAATAIEAGRSFEEYRNILVSMGASEAVLGQVQYEAAAAMAAHGVAAGDATEQMQRLGESFSALQGTSEVVDGMSGAMTNSGAAAGINADQMLRLAEQAYALAEANPAAAESVIALNGQLEEGTITQEQYLGGLQLLISNQEYAASTSFGYADAQLAAADATDVTTDSAYAAADSIYYLSEEQANNTNEAAEAELAALNLADAQAMMEHVVLNVQSGLYSQADALAILQAQFNLSEGAALRFLNVQLALNAALGKQTSIANMGKLVNVGGKAYERQVVEQQRSAERAGAQARREADRASSRAARPARSSGGSAGRAGGATGGATGKKAGKSPAVKQAEDDQKAIEKIRGKALDATEKYLDKQRELEQTHAEKVKAINDKANADRLAATKKLQDEQIQGRAGFYASLVGMDIADQQAAKARYEEHWRIRGELAAAGKQKEADAYMAAADEELQADLQRNAEIKAAREELNQALIDGDAARVAQLQADIDNLTYSDKLLDDAAAARLEKLKQANDSIAEEQARALEEENQNFSEAGAKLKEDFDATIADISEGFGSLSDAARTMANDIIAAAQAATAAVNAIPMPSAGGGEPLPVEAKAGGGRFIASHLPKLIGEDGPEILARGTRGYVLNNPEVQALAARSMGVPDAGGLARSPATASASGGARSSSTVTNGGAVTIMPGAIVIQAGNANPAQIAVLVDQRLRKFTQDTGGSAASKRKMGGR